MSKDVIELIGVVQECFPNATFRVRIVSSQARDHELHCHLAGRMRLHRVRILPGDRVKVEMTPYDLEKGRIVFRFHPSQPIPELGEKPPPTITDTSSSPSSLPSDLSAEASAKVEAPRSGAKEGASSPSA